MSVWVTQRMGMVKNVTMPRRGAQAARELLSTIAELLRGVTDRD